MESPYSLFNTWYNEEKHLTKARIPSACCLSTQGFDGYPNARFVSLKEIKDECFVVAGSLSSRKGREIVTDNKVSLTFWWPAAEKQVRIQGEAFEMQDQEAAIYFGERERDSQIVSSVSRQGEVLDDPEMLDKKYQALEMEYQGRAIPKPPDWGAWLIKPVRIELMAFKDSRFHERTLFKRTENAWAREKLQP